jgi:hypothetical protein
MDGPFSLGLHRGRQVGDLLEMEFHGPVSLKDGVGLLDHAARMLAEHGTCYLLCDVTDVSSIDADARRYMSEWNRTHRTSASALYGASFGLRAIVTLLINAIALLGLERPTLQFFRDEPEARRWLDVRRAARPT